MYDEGEVVNVAAVGQQCNAKKVLANLMNTDHLTEEVGLCANKLCSGLACPPEH